MHLPQRLVVLLAREAKMAGEAIKKVSESLNLNLLSASAR
jgi:hypothetical protein